MIEGKHILLVVSGGIAAYKSLDLVRRLRDRGAVMRCVLTRGGAAFVTPLSLAALSEAKVYSDLFSLTDENEMGHIRLSREADLIVVAPATADLLARMATGRADDLATAVLLATDKPILVAPAMNHRMWGHGATQANIATLEARGVRRVGPNEGAMACGERGMGRLAEVDEIVAAIDAHFRTDAPLSGRRALVTSGPTFEPLDPVRYLANRSSGKQGHAVAAALARLGAETTLVSGPTALADPPGVRTVHVETAAQMLAACEAALPADVAVCVAAVADWRAAAPAPTKIKKADGAGPPVIALAANPDILETLSHAGDRRPRLVVGFAAETPDPGASDPGASDPGASDPEEIVAAAIIAEATAKRGKKGCDWILANDVSAGTGTFGGDTNAVHLIDAAGAESWPRLSKVAVAERLAARIGAALGPGKNAGKDATE